ncbi:hypothetical protein [Hymenobacter cellulosivorans]|uniref:ABC transporter permease n=1 Tax=Hymenobacter cellulosivorans TaxID=2932249 RepID=A0ABY4FAC7_9BACT|nr:hypothetical protein [Hymenobacter cellulosivorans]UOQ52968.1 hypothetical protein MUN80_24925 [Hymenobacter cellulosivorans]
MSAVLRLGQLLLRVIPQRLWWVLGALVFGLMNMVFSSEVWPNTPLASRFFTAWTVGCGVLFTGGMADGR